MPSNLHVIFPADSYIPGGIIEAVALTCNNGTSTVKNKIQQVLIQILSGPFDVVEVYLYGPNVIPATKITNACTGEITYVAEKYNDVIAAQACCIVNLPVPGEQLLDYYWTWENFDFYEQVQTDDNLLWKGHGTEPVNAVVVKADYRSAPLFQWLGLKTKATQPPVVSYNNSLGINGPIPDPVWRDPITVGDWAYTITFLDVAFDPTKETFFNR